MTVNLTNTIAEINDEDAAVLHLQTGFSSIDVNIIESEESLPFSKLDGENFERLCYQLLLAEGYAPRFFGKSGSKDYGVDLVSTDGSSCVVYQCKKYTDLKSFPKSKMEETLSEFKNEWLARTYLPKPEKFVLCIPLSLRNLKTNEIWTNLQEEFYKETNVKIDAWDLERLNRKLKKLPDVVADVFSSQAAERFCNLPNWQEDVFRPVKQGSGDLIIKRYLTLKNAKRLYLDPKLRESFTEKLAVDGSLLIQGLPGSGKSLTCLAFSEELSQRHFRVFYVNMQYDISENDLFEGVKRRLSRPTVFLFDNCQGKYGLLENLYDRLAVLPSIGRHRLIFISRISSTGRDLPLREYPAFVENMKEKQTLLTFQPTAELFQKIIALGKPELTSLSAARLDKIYDITARDLYLLDQLLDIIQAPEDIDRLQTENIFQATLKRYFGGETARSEYLLNLSALCQFELAPPVGCFKPQVNKDDETAKTQLVIEADSPVRYYFIHSSAAELIYRALISSEQIENYHSKTVAYLIDYFKHLIVYLDTRKHGNQTVAAEITAALRNRLKLEENREKENELKSLLLADDEIYAFIDKNFACFSPVFMVLSLTILKSTDKKAYQRYCNLLQRKVDDGTLLSVIINRSNTQILEYVKTEFPEWYISLQTQFCETGISTLIQTKDIRNVLALFSSFATLRNNLLTTSVLATAEHDWQNMVQRTIDSKCSIGTISFPLRELEQINEDLLKQLEQKIGTTGYLKLIAELGTVPDLLNIIQRSSLSMAEKLIESLDESFLDNLIEKTIKEERSIGTINWTLFELKRINKDLSKKLERRIGVARWWRLISANGNTAVLQRLMEYMTFDFRKEMAAYTATFSPDVWAELIKRGNFKSLAAFTRWGIFYFSKLFSKNLLDELTPSFEELIARSQWSILNQSGAWLEKSPDSLLKKHLQKLLKEHLRKTDIGKLKFESFSEAANYFGLLNHNTSRQRPEFASLFDILPDETTWYDDENFLHDARVLFFALTNSIARPEDFIRVLNSGNHEDVAALFSEGTTLDILLYLWNLYALWYEVESQKPKEQRISFRNFLNPVIVSKTQEVLLKRLSELSEHSERNKEFFADEDNEQDLLNSRTTTNEIEVLIALGGFLSSWKLISLEQNEKEKISLALFPDEPLKSLDEIDSFLIAAFYLLGLEWLFGELEKRITLRLAKNVLSKKDNYTLWTAKAMEGLYKAIRIRYGI